MTSGQTRQTLDYWRPAYSTKLHICLFSSLIYQLLFNRDYPKDIQAARGGDIGEGSFLLRHNRNPYYEIK